jgi:hypothetical protein
VDTRSVLDNQRLVYLRQLRPPPAPRGWRPAVAVGKNEGTPQVLGFPFPRLDSLPAVTTEGAWYNEQSQNWLAAWSGAAASLLWLERTQVQADHA